MTTTETPGEALTDRAPSQGIPSDAASQAGPTRDRMPRWAIVAGLTTIISVVPLAVALGVLRQPRWYPLLDMAMTELRLRDVGTADTPLIGLPGRIEALGERGSHPGPISFWVLAPFYRLFGGTAWAMQAAAAALNVVAVGLTIWIAQRRGGTRLAVGMAAVLVLAMRLYGPEKLTEAWNPYIPMLWWVVFLLAVWSVLCDDIPMLPVAVLAGTLAAQTHIPYTGLVGGVGAVAAAVLITAAVRRMDPTMRRRVVRWGVGSLTLFVVLWIPPVIDQVTNDPGNISIIREYFSDPPEDPVGIGSEAFRFWFGHMNPIELVNPPPIGVTFVVSPVPGAIFFAVWAVTAAAAWTMRHRHADLARLHLVIAAALAFGWLSITRILGLVWFYLVLWGWGTTALMLVSVLWTVTLAYREGHMSKLSRRLGDAGARLPSLADRGGLRPGIAILGAATLATAVAFTYDAAHTPMQAPRENEALAHLAPSTVEALRSGEFLGGGESGRYLVRWDQDALSIGSQGYAMFLELERQGFDVGATDSYHAAGATPQRVLQPEDATAAIHYVVGAEHIDLWRDYPDAVLIDAYEPRAAGEIQRFDQLHDEVQDELRVAGLDDIAELVDNRLFMVQIHPELPPALLPKVVEMIRLSLPAAVFVTPPEVSALNALAN
jgi:hypothetical protein